LAYYLSIPFADFLFIPNTSRTHAEEEKRKKEREASAIPSSSG